MWSFNVTSGNWTQIAGSIDANQDANYTAGNDAQPGCRIGATMRAIKSNLYLFGGGTTGIQYLAFFLFKW